MPLNPTYDVRRPALHTSMCDVGDGNNGI